MIELSVEQRKAVENGEPIRVKENGHEYDLLRPDVYASLAAYDPSPWTDDEMDVLAEEAGDLLDNYKP